MADVPAVAVDQGDEIDELTHVLEESEGSQIVLQVYSTTRKELRGAPRPSLGSQGGGVELTTAREH